MANDKIVVTSLEVLDLQDAINDGFDAINSISALMMAIDGGHLSLTVADVNRIGFIISNCIRDQKTLIETFFKEHEAEV